MFAKAIQPEQLSSDELDDYLSRGWFRMGQTIFTTNFIHFKNEYYSTLWLRIVLNELQNGVEQSRLFKRNAAFHTTIRPAELTSEKEDLYARYKQPLPFQPSETLHTLLFGKSTSSSVYHTLEVTVYDNDRLIAFGFFDMGRESAAGIVSVYDPAYKKFSLGKYLIYQKIKYCQELNLRYFYPGYFVPGYKLFDYKLDIGREALQFFKISTQQWVPTNQFSDQDIPIQVMYQKLIALQKLLIVRKMECKVYRYEFFDANLVPELREAELFDYPLLLTFNQTEEEGNPVIVFDVREMEYRILKCYPVWQSNSPHDDPDVYSEYLLKIAQEFHSNSQAEVIANSIEKVVIPLRS